MSDNVGDDWYEDGYVALEVTHAPRDEGGEEKHDPRGRTSRDAMMPTQTRDANTTPA